MFRNTTNEAHLPGGQSPASPKRHGVASARLDAQESSWIGLLSVVSRPALSFLQKYVTGRPRNLTYENGRLKGGFVDEESEFFRRLDDMVTAPRLTYLRCEHDAAAGLLEPSASGSLSWLTADSLREMGIQSPEEGTLNRAGHFSSVRTFLSHVVLSSCQETKPTAGKDWGISKTRTWWGSFWGAEETSQKGLLSDLSWAEEETVTWRLCPQQPVPETKAAETTNVFVRGSGMESTLGENTGQHDHKDQLVNNGGLHTVQNSEGSTAGYRLSISDHLSSSESAVTCSEVALLTPDQDNGYSSLEEEHIQMSRLYGMKASGGESETSVQTEMAEKKEQVDEEEGMQDKQKVYQEGQTTGTMVLSTPQCQNKAIAFIMGCPYNDDSSQSDRESSDDDDDDDDGFDSEGLSDLSNSDEDDEESSDSDSETDSEAERLWSSLCQSQDPYNPRNFTAQVATTNTPPRTIPTSTPPSSTPASSPQLVTSSSPPCTYDFFDDSTSASEVDEAESLRLWSSFSCSSDPYSPFNFQAPLRTRGPAQGPPRAKSRVKKATHTPPHSPQKASSPHEHRKEETEEMREHSSSSFTSLSSPTKKVRFCDDVEEFFASCGEEEEDRRGPWEELARDRCRFLRRCQEVEQSIAYCLQPQHRSLMYRRLTVQDA